MEDAEKALSKAKIGLMMMGSTFLMAIAFNVNHIIDPTIPTAGTDGLVIKYNPEFLLSLSEEERISLVIHETWHIALMHGVRSEGKDHKLYNKAADYVINQFIKDDGLAPLPKWLQHNKYRGMSTNQVYALLEKDPTTPDLPMPDILITKASKEEAKEIQEKLETILVKAQMQSEMAGDKAGTVPEEISRNIKRLIDPELPWEEILSSFLADQDKTDYSWRKPNRRFMPEFYLPSLYSEQLTHLTFAIDTSGSVTDKDLVAMLSEIKYINEVMRPHKMTIIDCDSTINHIHEITPDTDILDLKFSGGGGTSCYPVMRYCKDHPTTALVYFTDLFMPDYNQAIDFPLLWIVYNNPTRTIINIGEITHYNIEGIR